MRDAIAITRIRIGAVGRVRIATARARVVIESSACDLTIAVGDGPAIEVRVSANGARKASTKSRGLLTPAIVSPEMEQAAVAAFLGGADVVRLGRSLAAVYGAMEAVRREQGDDEDDAGSE